jgi:Family of unknown function (DUF6092)
VEFVLSENEAVELLAYLVTAARTQLDEPAEYGPLRLLAAAQRLGEMILPRVSDPVRQLVTGPLRQLGALPLTHEEGSVARLDNACVAVAELAMQRAGLRDGQRTQA